MSNARSFLEMLVETAVEVPSKPGAFSIDSQALRTLLFELVRSQRVSGEASTTNLKASNEKLLQEVNTLQFHVKQIDKKMDQLSGLFDSVERLEDVISEIRENERIISESTNLLIADVEATQEQVEMLGQDTISVGQNQLLDELVERIEALESVGATKKFTPASTSAHRRSTISQPSISGAVRRRSVLRSRPSASDEVKMNLSSLQEKLMSEVLPVEPKQNMAGPFIELKVAVTALGMDRVSALEDFLSSLRASVSMQPKMAQELMVIFTSLPVDFFSLVVHAMNRHPALTVKAFAEILDLLLISAFDANALLPLWTQVSAQPPPLLPLDSLCAMLQCAKDATKVTPIGLSNLLTILVECEGLMDFLMDLIEQDSWNWKSMMNIAQELHFSKNSTLLELVVVMEKMEESELNELMSMLLTIPGYVNELILSLPHQPSLSTQRLLEHLISLPDDSPCLLAQAVALMVSSPSLKDNLLHMMRRLLELMATLESESRSSDTGFFQLLKMLHEAEHVSLASVGQLLKVITGPEAMPMNAVRALIQFTRDSKSDIVGALRALLLEMMECPDLKGELILRTTRLLGKAKFVSPRHIEELFTIMQQSAMLRQDNFDAIQGVFRQNELISPYNMFEFFSMLKHLDFLTLEDLGHVLEQNQAAAMKAYEDAVEKHNRRLQEVKEAQERLSWRTDIEEMDEQSSGTQELQGDDGKGSKEVKQETCTSDEDTTLPTSDEPSGLDTHSAALQQIPGVDSTLVQDMQKEIRELQITLGTLLEEKSRKGGDEKEKKEKKEKKRRKRLKQPAAIESSFSYTSQRTAELTPDAGIEMVVDYVEPKSDSAASVRGSLEDVSLQTSGSSSVPLGIQDSSQMVLDAELREEVRELRDMIERLSEHEKECQGRYQWLSKAVSVKAESGELNRFKSAVKRQLHNFANKPPPGPAGAKARLPVNCLSCDNKGINCVTDAEQSLPLSGAFPPVLSQRPHRVYEMDVIRRHARSLLEGGSERLDLYSVPRPCGGPHTSVDVRQTWTCEIKESVRADTTSARQNKNKSSATKTSSKSMDYLPRPARNNHRQ